MERDLLNALAEMNAAVADALANCTVNTMVLRTLIETHPQPAQALTDLLSRMDGLADISRMPAQLSRYQELAKSFVSQLAARQASG